MRAKITAITFSTALHVVLAEINFSTPCCVFNINKFMYNAKQRNLDTLAING